MVMSVTSLLTRYLDAFFLTHSSVTHIIIDALFDCVNHINATFLVILFQPGATGPQLLGPRAKLGMFNEIPVIGEEFCNNMINSIEAGFQ